MTKQTIAVDIDGVLADWVRDGVPRLNKILGTNVSVADRVGFNLHCTFGVSKAKITKAFDTLYEEFSIADLKPVIGSQKAIDLLHQKYNLIAITARPKKFWPETKWWIKKHFDKDIVVYFGAGAGSPVGGENHEDNKLELCAKYKAKYLIEDNPKEIFAALKTDTVPLCHAWPWNEEIREDKRIVRGKWPKLTEYLLRQS